ncbi:uncharacterized protein K452DRAFT_315081 [Aplosporella prunicola CBS 121167]|uniref:AB hydrolase-1 domain-containing protein n=1 Tax=Aplosporella prunicola CBS 121167 TaxID=1176127 RepID=A0A6A6BVJ4_9PEZI|nr:uncharacterized protein K452DRAFT_315081 [Aplosporella prunicola CBS 121167]KAF2146877.1 hypothetical protein K452DRAFT_315081 [Aplosporella prunicola CBS 121167]
MHPPHLAAFAALASVAASTKTCLNQTIPVTIESRNGVFDIAIPHQNLDVTTFVQNMTRQGHNFTNEALIGYQTVAGTYNISTKYCYDNDTESSPNKLQILTHGIGFDKTYWDLSYNNFNYSYINSALAAGYAALSYDRLGIGNSSHGEPLNEIQAFLEIAGMRALTTMLRTGSFPNVDHSYSSIVHVGHSFGSAQSYSFANMYPNETSGLVLTGFSMNSSFLPYFAAASNFGLASLNQPLRFGNGSAALLQQTLGKSDLYEYVKFVDLANLPTGQNLTDGYLTWANIQANQYNFFLPGHFDPRLLGVAEENKQPVTLGELLTLGSVPTENQFTGPVLVITGEADVPFCGGDCFATGGVASSIPAAVKASFNVSDDKFEAYIQPATGHSINAHYNATGAYQVINNWLSSQDL